MNTKSFIGRAAALTVGVAFVATSALLVGGSASAATPGYVTVPAGTPFLIEADAEYTEWHQGYDDVDPAVTSFVTDQGLVIQDKSQAIKGFATPLTLDPADLVEFVASAGISYTGDAPFFQIPLNATIEGTPVFATLRPADPTNLAGDWVSSKNFGSVTAGTAYPVADIAAAAESFEILGLGAITNPGESTLVRTIQLGAEGYLFGAADVVIDPKVVISPNPISLADIKDSTKGFTATLSGFTPNSVVTIALTFPDGTVIGFSDGNNDFVIGEDGTLVLDNLVLSGNGIVEGVYTFTVTNGADETAAATFTVGTPAAPAAVTAPQLANTGLDNTPLFVSGAAGLLLLVAGGIAMTVVRRRQNA